MNINYDFLRVCEVLKSAANSPKPGWMAHQIMAPLHRTQKTTLPPINKDVKQAAVMSCIFPNEHQQASMVFIERSSNENDVHAKQISFPGGKQDYNDDSFVDTAIRELKEELDVDVTSNNILLPLSPLFIPPSNFLVYGFVARLDELPSFSLSIDEVEAVHLISLEELFNPQNKKELIFTSSGGQSIKAPCYQIDHIKIWGATAMMVAEIEYILSHNFHW